MIYNTHLQGVPFITPEMERGRLVTWDDVLDPPDNSSFSRSSNVDRGPDQKPGQVRAQRARQQLVGQLLRPHPTKKPGGSLRGVAPLSLSQRDREAHEVRPRRAPEVPSKQKKQVSKANAERPEAKPRDCVPRPEGTTDNKGGRHSRAFVPWC